MQLTKNFSLGELTSSPTARANKINNLPDDNEASNLLLLATYILQPARDHLRCSINVNSGFRCLELNTLIKGSKTSDHMRGAAADISIPDHDLKGAFNWMKNKLKYGQIIYEAPPNKSPWIHVSLPRMGKPNQQAMTYDGNSYQIIEEDV